MSGMKQAVVAVTWVAFSIGWACGQDAGSPEFEVASVKHAEPLTGGPAHMPPEMADMIGFHRDAGRVDYKAVSLMGLLERAYGMKRDRIKGPGWLAEERYTIAAKVPPGATTEQLQLMLQKLLAERFRILQHRDTREMDVYRLKVAKNGPKLQPPEAPSAPMTAEERTAATRKRSEDMMARVKACNDAKQKGEYSSCNTRSFSIGEGTLDKFAETLSGNLDRPVKNLTQIEGKYSFKLEWTPDTGPIISDAPTFLANIFAALQQQLGLRLEPGKETIDLLVIDQAEKDPVSN